MNETVKKPAIDPATIKARTHTSYPEQFKSVCDGREKRALGDALGLNIFGVNHVTLQPGAASAHRHWHTKQDEFIYVLDGEVALVTDAGEQVLTSGMAAGFPAGVRNGHQLVNRSDQPAIYLEVGDRTDGDEADYPDIDMVLRLTPNGPAFFTKDGKPY